MSYSNSFVPPSHPTLPPASLQLSHPSVPHPTFLSLFNSAFSLLFLRSSTRPSLPRYYFICFFFFDLTVKLSNPLMADPYGVSGGHKRTVELVAAYVPCRRRRYSLSYPYRTSGLPSSFTGRYQASWPGIRAEPRVDFQFSTEGNDLGSPGLGLPSSGAPYVWWPYVLNFLEVLGIWTVWKQLFSSSGGKRT